MAIKAKMDEILSDMKSITMFTLSPAKKISKEDRDGKKDDKMKTKFLEAWNNLRYDLGAGASLKKDVPIWILGVCHHSRGSVTETHSDNDEDDLPAFDTALAKRVFTDFASRPWFTYRKQFPPIPGTNIVSDTGWGCMLRTAQMMVAQGLILHFLGREWRWPQRQTHHEKHLHRKILGWFIDHPGEHCPLSIHNLSEIGRRYGSIPGNWYGPNTVAYIMQQAIERSKEKVPELRDVAIYVALDCTVYSEDVYDLCGWRNTSMKLSEDSTIFPNAAKYESLSTSSASSDSEVYVDEVGSEVSEMSAFYVPQFSVEESVPSAKIIDNMIPMTEFVNSDSNNPEVIVMDSWSYPDHNKPVNLTPNSKSSTNSKTVGKKANSKLFTVAANEPKILKMTKPGCSDPLAQYDPSAMHQEVQDQKTMTNFQAKKNLGVSATITPGAEMAHDNPESTRDYPPPNFAVNQKLEFAVDTVASTMAVNEPAFSVPVLKVSQNEQNSIQKQKIRLYDLSTSYLNDDQMSVRTLPKNEGIVFNSENMLQKSPNSQATDSKIREIFGELSSKTGENSAPKPDQLITTTSDYLSHITPQSTNSKPLSPITALFVPRCTSNDGSKAEYTDDQGDLEFNLSFGNESSRVLSGSYTEKIFLTKREEESLRTSSRIVENVVENPDCLQVISPSSGIIESRDVDGIIPQGDRTGVKENLDVKDEGFSISSQSDVPQDTSSHHYVQEESLIGAPLAQCNEYQIFQPQSPLTHLERPNFGVIHPSDISASFPSPIIDPQTTITDMGNPDPRASSDPPAFSSVPTFIPQSTIHHPEKPASPHEKNPGIILPGDSLSPDPPSSSSAPKSAIILIPVRLGESVLNPIYIPCVQAMLSLESSIGVIGGKPKHSLYFVGFQDENLLHLDPHYCQIADTLDGYRKNLHEYHTMSIRKTNVKKIDPSCCFGFYCKNAQEFEKFKTEGRKNFSPPQQHLKYPMCLIMDGRSGDHQIASPLGVRSPINNPTPTSKDIPLPMNPVFDYSNDVTVNPISSSGHQRASEVNSGVKGGVRSPRKSRIDGFNMDHMGARLNKLNPFPKFMRQKSASPSRSKHREEEESLESQFELL